MLSRPALHVPPASSDGINSSQNPGTSAVGFEPTTAGLEEPFLKKVFHPKNDRLQQKKNNYFKQLKLSGVSESWHERCCKVVEQFLEGLEGAITEEATLTYLERLQAEYDVATYRKLFFQI
ncbi:MAG: hypothetical protein R6U10_02375, partial [Thermoplasmatota archaeon]